MRLGKPPIVDYGYEEQVLLVVPVRVANNVRVGTEAALIVHVKWLVCREICIPEKADLALHLPVHSSAEKNLGAAQLLFAETSNCLPKPLPDGWKIAAVSSRESFVLTLQTGARVSGASFFPIEPNQIDNSAPQKVDPNDRGIRLTLVKSEQLLKPVASLKGVLVLGQGRAYLVSVPVR